MTLEAPNRDAAITIPVKTNLCIPTADARWRLLVAIIYIPQVPKSEGESDLQFQTAIVGRLVKAFAIRRAGNLVGRAEQRRGDVAGNRPRIVVIQQIADRHRNGQVVAPAAGGSSDDASNSAARG